MSADDQPMLSPPEAGNDGAFPGGPRRPSATSIRPKGILKNAPSRQVSVDASMLPTSSTSGGVPASDTPGTEQHRLQWDEGNLALHDYEREQTTRMTIDEPKTPFVSSASLAPDDLPSSFSLDEGGSSSYSSSSSSASYFPGTASGSNGGSAPTLASGSGSGSGSRRGSTASSAEITARNTLANAQLGRRPSAASVTSSNGGSAAAGAGAGAGGAGLGLMDGSALENMAVDELEGGGGGTAAGASTSAGGAALPPRSRNSSTSSRTPSFSIPRSGSAGAAGADSEMRDEVRAERALDPDGQDEIEEEEEDEETKAKHEAFAAKRNQHYGNEAQAMRIAAALAAQEDDDDEDEEEGGGGDGGNARGAVVPPPVPPLPRINGHS